MTANQTQRERLTEVMRGIHRLGWCDGTGGNFSVVLQHQPLELLMAPSGVDKGQVPADQMILDLGPESVARLTNVFADSKTVVWNGPLGAFEVPPFNDGTKAAARQVAILTTSGELMSIAGGGDTVAALEAADSADDFSYVSMAGGAFLEWLEGRALPGVAVLLDG